MRPRSLTWVAVLSLLLGLAAGGLWLSLEPPRHGDPASDVRLATTNRVEGAALCPWREPARDLASLFPGATNAIAEVRILSGRRPELTRRLGRMPEPEENSLHVHAVLSGGSTNGVVLVRRVKGEFGAIEIVVGVAPDGRIAGVVIQRMREPEVVAGVLGSPAWLGTLTGLRVDAGAARWESCLAVPPEARISARAVVEGIRSLLILLDVSGSGAVPRTAVPGLVLSGHSH